ncbi:MAG: hypothetical protein P8M22_08960 [Phycisphaerales bacterium]|nr:hypothetical protein [Phycisphaerales bacterium]
MACVEKDSAATAAGRIARESAVGDGGGADAAVDPTAAANVLFIVRVVVRDRAVDDGGIAGEIAENPCTVAGHVARDRAIGDGGTAGGVAQDPAAGIFPEVHYVISVVVVVHAQAIGNRESIDYRGIRLTIEAGNATASVLPIDNGLCRCSTCP